MVGHLKTIGDDNVLVLDKGMMEQIGLSANGEVRVSVSEGAILVTPLAQKADQAKFEACLDRVVKKHSVLLARLAQ